MQVGGDIEPVEDNTMMIKNLESANTKQCFNSVDPDLEGLSDLSKKGDNCAKAPLQFPSVHVENDSCDSDRLKSVNKAENHKKDGVWILDESEFPPLKKVHIQENSTNLIEHTEICNESCLVAEDIRVDQAQHLSANHVEKNNLNDETNINVEGRNEEVKKNLYSSVVRSKDTFSHLDVNIQSDSKQYIQGEPAFIITEDEWKESIQTCKWQCILKFSLAYPPLKIIKEQLANNWGLSLMPIVGLLDNRHVLVSAHSEDDCRKILAKEKCKMGRGVFRVFRWSEDFDKQKESPIIQRWIRLPGLPSNCFSHSMLKGIGTRLVSSLLLIRDLSVKKFLAMPVSA